MGVRGSQGVYGQPKTMSPVAVFGDGRAQDLLKHRVLGGGDCILLILHSFFLKKKIKILRLSQTTVLIGRNRLHL